MKKNQYILLLILWAQLALGSISDDTVDLIEMWKDIVLKTAVKQKPIQNFRDRTIASLAGISPGTFGENIRGVIKTLPKTAKKTLALTLDACSGRGMGSFDKEMIDWLTQQKVKATLFLSGKWIRNNPNLTKELAQNPLFDIQNHGYDHYPASSMGQSAYNIPGTKDIEHLFDEIIQNQNLLESITGRKTRYYRPGTGFIDHKALKLSQAIGHRVIGYDVVAGDASHPQSKTAILKNLRRATSGSIIIIHMNHPEWQSFEALKEWTEEKLSQGFQFVHLDDPGQIYPL